MKNKEVKKPSEAFVDFANEITEKAEKFTAEKLENIEKKAKVVLNDTKATIENQARTLNNLTNKKVNEFKSTVDTILFE